MKIVVGIGGPRRYEIEASEEEMEYVELAAFFAAKCERVDVEKCWYAVTSAPDEDVDVDSCIIAWIDYDEYLARPDNWRR